MEWKELPRWVNPRILIDAQNGASALAYLDSSDNINPYGRHSILGLDPFLRLIYKDGRVILDWKDGERTCQSDPWETIRDLLLQYRISEPFSNILPAGAAIGFFSYDLGMELEGVKSLAKPALGWPLMEFAFYDLLFCFTMPCGPNLVISTGLPAMDPEMRRRRAKKRLNDALKGLQEMQDVWMKKQKKGESRLHEIACDLHSNFDRQSYLRSIERIKAYISSGDVYQVNLSQAFSGKIGVSGWSAYQHIRKRNRVPFGAYLRFQDREALCFSMERFLRMQGKRVETRPIKGTRPRGKDREEDLRMAQELSESKKDQAELVMIVDMERNDLGKVCRPGSVRVDRLFDVEKYATVFHLVSTISGELEDSADQIHCMRACLPGGSITGAPKIRAMEIIDELEGIKREVYCGSIGYLGFNNVSDFNIPIRTIQKEGEHIRFNAGGGVLYDSDPDSEYQETLHKVRSFIESLSPQGFSVG